MKKELIKCTGFNEANSTSDVVKINKKFVWMSYAGNGSQKIIESNQIETGNSIYEISVPNQFRDSVSVATGYGKQKTGTELWNEIKSLVSSVVYFHNPDDLTFYVSYIFATWVFDLYSHVCYIAITGPPGVGKSRVLDVAKHLCFKNYRAGGGDSFASTFRTLNKLRGSLVLDECQQDSSDPSTDWHKMLALGNEESGSISRVRIEKNSGNDVIDIFNIFGPKVFSGASFSHHEAIISRTYDIQMVQCEVSEIRKLKHVNSTDWLCRAESLKNDLMLFRQRRFSGEICAPNLLNDFENEIASLSSREIQVFDWILKEAPDKSIVENLISILKNRKEKLLSIRAITHEVKIKLAIRTAIIICQSSSKKRLPLLTDVQGILSAWGEAYMHSKTIANICRKFSIDMRPTNRGAAIICSLSKVDSILIQSGSISLEGLELLNEKSGLKEIESLILNLKGWD